MIQESGYIQDTGAWIHFHTEAWINFDTGAWIHSWYRSLDTFWYRSLDTFYTGAWIHSWYRSLDIFMIQEEYWVHLWYRPNLFRAERRLKSTFWNSFSQIEKYRKVKGSLFIFRSLYTKNMVQLENIYKVSLKIYKNNTT